MLWVLVVIFMNQTVAMQAMPNDQLCERFAQRFETAPDVKAAYCTKEIGI